MTMVARWMQEKQLKIKKMRRSHLKSYTMHAGNKKGPNRDVLKEYQQRAYDMGIDASGKNDWLKTIFGWRAPDQGVNQPRREAQERKREIMIQEKETRLLYGKLEETKYRKVGVWFEENDGPAFFVEIDFRLKLYRRSILYYRLTIAKTVWGMKQVRWNVWEDIPPDPSPA